MTQAMKRPFRDLDAADLAAVASAANAGLAEPAALAAVVENLLVLQGHAAIVAAALAAAGVEAAAPAGAFEP